MKIEKNGLCLFLIKETGNYEWDSKNILKIKK